MIGGRDWSDTKITLRSNACTSVYCSLILAQLESRPNCNARKLVTVSSFDQVSKRAKKLEAKGQTSEAIKLYELFLQQFPKNARAKAALTKLQPSANNAVQEAYNTARKLIERGEFARGVTVAQQIVEKMPDNVQVWNLLGMAYFQGNKPVDSERCLRKAIEIDNSFGMAWENIAKLYYAQNRLDLALTAFQNASYLDPENAALLSSIAGILISMRRLEEAEKFCVQAIRKQPDLSGAYNNLAIIFYRKKNELRPNRHLKRLCCLIQTMRLRSANIYTCEPRFVIGRHCRGKFRTSIRWGAPAVLFHHFPCCISKMIRMLNEYDQSIVRRNLPF